MSGRRSYLDYNATAPLRPEAREALCSALEICGNPSSVHHAGRAARAVLEKGRREVAALVGVEPRHVIFTSGATEANATVLAQPRWAAVAVSAVEHPSVLAAAQRLGDRLSVLPVDGAGRVSLDALRDWLAQPAGGDRLVSVQWANSETGVLQPVDELARLARQHGAVLHVDAVQAAGRLPIDFPGLGLGYLTLSSHKIGGPQGIGAIVQGTGGEIRYPLLMGGGQEQRLRSGTENVAGAAGFGAAAVLAADECHDTSRPRRLRDMLEGGLRTLTPNAVVMGVAADRLANTSCVALPGHKAETLVIAFDLKGLAISSGSACSSGKVGRSHVLAAMGMPEAIATAALRISLGWASTEDDVDRFIGAWADVMKVGRSTPAQVA